MITKNSYKEIQVMMMSGVAKMKNKNEMWYEDEDEEIYESKTTIQLFKNNKILVRYYENECMWMKRTYKNGVIDREATYNLARKITDEKKYKNGRLIWTKEWE